MKTKSIACGFLRVLAVEMIKPVSKEMIGLQYKVDQDGYMRLSMNALLAEGDEHIILVDPGAADFLPLRLRREYGLEIPVSLEEGLIAAGVLPEQVTDVIFTHLHFDHASGAFKRVPGNIVKRFPNARYHVLKEHYQYALNPDPSEAGSFCTGLLKYLDRIYWLEDWDLNGIEFRVFNGHTRGMVVPMIREGVRETMFMSDLLPMEIFLQKNIWCGYDLDPELQLKEKREFLRQLGPESRMYFFHEILRMSIIYK